jgi:preprotein translocase subunit SecA
MYSPEGFKELEYDQIVKNFCEILPLDHGSQERLEKQLAKVKTPEKVTETLTGLLTSAYQKREEQVKPEVMREMERVVYLRTIDRLWIDHLDAMDDLREGIGLRGEQQALTEYKKEAFGMFETLVARIDEQVIRRIFRIQVAQPQPTVVPRQVQTNVDQKDQMGLASQVPASAQGQAPPVKVTPSKPAGTQKIGRNDPCWCGSGKKFKKCHYPQYS